MPNLQKRTFFGRRTESFSGLMYLKSLQIHGFKSFADKTIFEFAEGVTGIVGPNGCGKSNVVDAIRWVLGETSAKALRGGEMADVIFNGSEKRKKLGMAEVTLTMADCEQALKTDFNEVSITRRVFADGKSEYLINNTRCRLRDIGDLFMDTGIGRSSYSIMEQGKIDMLLSAKPEDRRQVFEEAAGITKSKREKRDALRKLEYTEGNLLRVSDVLAEQERRMNSLKRQVAKAKRYQALAKDVRILDTHMSHRTFERLTGERAELLTSLSSLFKNRDLFEAEVPKRERAVVEARDKAQAIDAELSVVRQKLSEKRSSVAAAQSRISFNNERKTELSERLSQSQKDISATESSLSEQQESLLQSQAALQNLEERIGQKEDQVQVKQDSLSAMIQSRQEVEQELRKVRSEANSTQQIIASSQAKIESALSQMEGNRERMKQLEEEAQRLAGEQEKAVSERDGITSQLQEHQKQWPGLEEARETIQREFEELRGKLDLARKSAAETHRELSQRSSRLDVLKQLVESGEGLEKGTQAILKGLNDPDLIKPGIKGLLGAELKAPDQYAAAIESALSDYLQAIIIRDEELADTIIERLVEGKKGNASLLPESFLPVSEGTQMEALPDGASSWALDVVTVDSRLSGLMEHLLARVLIVPERKIAFELRKNYPDLTFVTLSGELLTPEGILRGGSGSSKNSLLKRRNEIEALGDEVASLRAQEKAQEQEILDAENLTKSLREDLEQAKDRLQRHKIEESTLSGQLKLATREADGVESKVKNNRWETTELEKREETATGSRSSLEGELKGARERLVALEDDARRIQGQVEEFQKQEKDSQEELSEARTALAVEKQARDSAAREQDPMSRRIHELSELNKRRRSEIESSGERILQGEKENVELQQQIKEQSVEIEKLVTEIDRSDEQRRILAQGIASAESELSEARTSQNKVLNQINKEEVAVTKLDLRLENLIESIMERHQVDLNHFRPDTHQLIACINSRKDSEKRGRRAVSPDLSNDIENQVEPDAENVSDEIVEGAQHDSLEQLLEGSGPDWEFVEAIVADLKRRLDSMGPVNLDAIEEYDELEDRYNFTKNQHDDLVSSKAKLLEIIERINTESERLFAETFAQVSKNFRSMFKRLFGEKAQADLILQDESDPLECGIEVIAKPPGKKLQSITLMSGGERSMTAVALLFSIYMVKPSPFCVLDELDAPLDESNIGRFLKVLDAFIDQSQFIIVTHSKRTMERADVIYGVTMEEFGVSKPVGMRLTSDSSKKGSQAKTAAQKAALKLDA